MALPPLLVLSLLIIVPEIAISQSIVTSLPGFPGPLPFKLETGYVGVGEGEDVNLFYFFVESERDPRKDPLLLWLTGGPGCSGLSTLIFENIGPLIFDYEDFDGDFPVLKANPYSWTKMANIIFLDAPVGTGYSYSENASAYNISDTISASQIYEFLQKWLLSHPEFLSNALYVAGESYSGLIIPIVVQAIHEGIIAGNVPVMKLEGYLMGSPLTDRDRDIGSRVEYAYRVNLLDQALYESVKESCHGEYVHIDHANVKCMEDMSRVDETYNYAVGYIWANNLGVQNALHVREGTINEWVRCNTSMSCYVQNVRSTVSYHQNFTHSPYRALIYSGDQDSLIPYVGTLQWIRLLNLSVESTWRPWFVDGQVSGYTVEYKEDQYRLTYATLKGAGHTGAEFKPVPALAMAYRWLSHFYL